ncbi:MAG: hypothetical protein ACK4YF_05730 [Exilispira sp.]
MKDLKRYNNSIKIIFIIFLIIFIYVLLSNLFIITRAKFFYLRSDLTIKSEYQIIPDKLNQLQFVRYYFSGPIDVKKFKKDIFQQLEIEKVIYINNICKIVLSKNSSLIFLNYQDDIKEKISKATLLTLKSSKLFKDIKAIEFFIFDKIKVYSFKL